MSFLEQAGSFFKTLVFARGDERTVLHWFLCRTGCLGVYNCFIAYLVVAGSVEYRRPTGSICRLGLLPRLFFGFQYLYYRKKLGG